MGVRKNLLSTLIATKMQKCAMIKAIVLGTSDLISRWEK